MDARFERRALVFGGAHDTAEILLSRQDDIAQDVDTTRRGLAQVNGSDAGDRQRLGQLCALVFDMDGEVFLVGTQGKRG